MKTKLLKFTKLHLTKLLSIFFFILLFSSYLSTFAIGQPYNPGETLDPSCAPGDTNCTVTVGGTPSGSSGQIQFNNGGLFAGTADLTWTAGTATSHFSIGPGITFTKADYETVPNPAVDEISPSVHITRDQERAIYNTVSESEYDNSTYLSPLGTEWNSADGWSDLSNISTRTYDTFYNALGGSIGDNIIGAELVMHDIAEDTYYKFSFSFWASNGAGGGFSYTRNLIDPLTFALGPSVTFTKTFPTDIVSTSVHLTRAGTKGLYNPLSEQVYDDNDYLSPLGTEWNSDGWNDLADVDTRTYDTFYNVLGQSIGDNIIGAELVMHDIAQNKYYKFSFSSWTQSGNGSGFSYTRNLITLGNGSENLLTTSSNLLIGGSARYLNFGTNSGNSGYGIRDTGGVLQFKHDGGAWANLGEGPINIVNQTSLFSGGTMTAGTGSTATNSMFLGKNAGNGTTNVYQSNFFGLQAGENATSAFDSNFIGYRAGQLSTDAYNSNFIGRYAGNQAASAYNSNFLGTYAGGEATYAYRSNFLGENAGGNATNANNSNFLGRQAGYQATNAPYSNFFGTNAGQNAASAAGSNFIGYYSGNSAINASDSNFLGTQSGKQATNASNSNFFGFYAGYQATNAHNSIFIGQQTGQGSTDANNSIFMGAGSGTDAINAHHSNFLGSQAGSGAPNAANSIFIGTNAGNGDTALDNVTVSGTSIIIGDNSHTGNFSNSIVLGPSATNTMTNQFLISPTYSNFRIRDVDYVMPASQGGASTVLTNDGSGGLTWASAGGTSLLGATSSTGTETWLGTSPASMGTASTGNTVFIGLNSGYNASGAYSSNFIGNAAGYQATNAFGSNFFSYGSGMNATGASYSNFIGEEAGSGATSANSSNFLGRRAGQGATGANSSNFIGSNAGNGAINAYSSNFFGMSAGNGATGAYGSNFLGSAGANATSAHNSNFLGDTVGSGATNAFYSNFIGYYTGNGATNASYSNIFGWNAGSTFFGNNIGSNNIIIGTNISLPNATANAINLGGVLFGTGTYSTYTGDPSITPIAGGKIGIGVVSPSYQLQLSTDSAAKPSTNTWTVASDSRLKTDITPYSKGLDILRQINPISYKYNGKAGFNPSEGGIGVIAQDMMTILPETVTTFKAKLEPTDTEDTELYNFNSHALTYVMLNSIKEMDLRVKGIENLNEGSVLFDNIKAWLGNATNHITRIFTGELCLTDEGGESECINRAQLKDLKKLISTLPASGGSSPVVPIVPTEVIPESQPEDNSNTTPETTPIVETPIVEIPTPSDVPSEIPASVEVIPPVTNDSVSQ